MTMDDRSRRRSIIQKAIAIPLVVAALGFIAWFIFRDGPGNRPSAPLGNNADYAEPRPDQPPGTPVDSVTLVENANAWNGRVITFTGEAVGELMVRGDMAWVHVNDDAYKTRNLEEGGPLSGFNSGQAVWISAAQTRAVGSYGDYTRAGDLIAVAGVFHAACREHGGDMDIHATSLAVLRAGRAVAHPLKPVRLLAALVLLLAAGGLFVLRRVTARK